MSLVQLTQDVKAKAPEVVDRAEASERIVQQLQQEIRTASYLLHPPLLDERGLTSALGWYTTGLTERTGLNISLNIPEDFGRLQGDIELVIFRLVQECLTNIHRHSGSKTASIRLSRGRNTVVLEVRDEGKGIRPEKLSDLQSGGSGVGIRGMRERVAQLSGEMIVESDSSGTRISVTIPISKTIAAGEARLGESLQAAI